MDVRCPECQTLYELDDDQVAAKSVTLKCSQCHHVFRLEPIQRSAIFENQRRWMISKADGEVLYLSTLVELHAMMMEQSVGKDDRISRTGDSWVALGDIGEFTPVFQVVESISSIAGGLGEESSNRSALEDAPSNLKSEDATVRERVRTSMQFGHDSPPSKGPGQIEARSPRQTEELASVDVASGSGPMPSLPPRPERSTPTPAPGPVPTEEPPKVRLESDRFGAVQGEAWDDGIDLAAEVSGTHEAQPRPRPAERSGSGGTYLLILLVLGLIGGGVYVAMFQPELFASVVGPKNSPVVIGSAENPKTDDSASNPDTRAHDLVSEAVGRAQEAASRATDERWTRILLEVADPVHQAVLTGEREAGLAAKSADSGAVLAEADRALERGSAGKAKKLYTDVLKTDPGNVKAMTGLGWALLSNGNADAATTHFRRVIKKGDPTGDAFIGLGSAERQRGNLKAAYDAYDRYLGRYPRGKKASIAMYQMEQLAQQLGM